MSLKIGFTVRHSHNHDDELRGAMMGQRMIPSDVKYETVPNGARLLFTPKDPGPVEELRSRVGSTPIGSVTAIAP